MSLLHEQAKVPPAVRADAGRGRPRDVAGAAPVVPADARLPVPAPVSAVPPPLVTMPTPANRDPHARRRDAVAGARVRGGRGQLAAAGRVDDPARDGPAVGPPEHPRQSRPPRRPHEPRGRAGHRAQPAGASPDSARPGRLDAGIHRDAHAPDDRQLRDEVCESPAARGRRRRTGSRGRPLPTAPFRWTRCSPSWNSTATTTSISWPAGWARSRPTSPRSRASWAR